MPKWNRPWGVQVPNQNENCFKRGCLKWSEAREPRISDIVRGTASCLFQMPLRPERERHLALSPQL